MIIIYVQRKPGTLMGRVFQAFLFKIPLCLIIDDGNEVETIKDAEKSTKKT